MQTRDEDFVTRLFVASTHTPVLFFSSHGRVYKEKVWRLPQAAPQARGKALINILPLDAGRAHHHHHAAARGREHLGRARRDVRDHARARCGATSSPISSTCGRSGIIAMKLDDGEAIVDVQICTETRRRAAHRRRRPMHPLCGDRRARVPGPHLDGRARHRACGRRQGDLACHPAPRRCKRRGARRVSQARERGAARNYRPRPRRRREEAEEAQWCDRARRAALCGDVRGRAVRAHGF